MNSAVFASICACTESISPGSMLKPRVIRQVPSPRKPVILAVPSIQKNSGQSVKMALSAGLMSSLSFARIVNSD